LIRSGFTHSSELEENQFRLLAEMMPHLAWIRNVDGTIEYCNQRWYDYTKTIPENISGENWLNSYHPDDRRLVIQRWKTALQTVQPYEVEYRLRNGQTGEYRWFVGRAEPLLDSQGHILKWFGTTTDIDKYKRKEEALRQQKEELYALGDVMPHLIWTARRDGYVEYANQRWYDYTHASGEQTRGNGWISFFYPADQPKVLALWHTSLLTSQPFEAEARLYKHETDEYRWFLMRITPILNTYGQVRKWLGTCTDIHEKKHMEEAWRLSETRFRKLFTSNIIGVIISSMEGTVLDANEAFLQLVDYTRRDLIAGKIHWGKLLGKELYLNDPATIQQLRATGHLPSSEKELTRKDGSHVWTLLGTTVLDPFNQTIIAFALDISSRKTLDQRKDEFISLASHELKSPLAGLKLIAQYLIRKLQKGEVEGTEKYLGQITTQVDNFTRLVDDLLDLSKIQAGKLTYVEKPFDLDALIHEIVDTTRQTTATHQLLLQGVAQTAMVGDRYRIGQVLTNILSNAIKYSPLGEKIELRVARCNNSVTIRIRDYGPGITREHQHKIFERFYRISSQKESGIAGLGIGLYISYTIIKHYDGDITIESTPGNGSVFCICLPVPTTL